MAVIIDHCSLSDLISDSECVKCLSETEKKAAIVYYLAQALLGLGGTDLTVTADLRDAVKCWCVPDATLESFMVVVAGNAAVDSGQLAALKTIAELRDAIKCLVCIPQAELRKMEVLLICKLLKLAVPTPLL